MKQTEYSFQAQDFESQLPQFAEKGITEFAIHDAEFAKDKGRILRFLKAAEKNAPDLFIDLTAEAASVDMDVCRELSRLNSSVDIPLRCTSLPGNSCTFDKKLYAGRAQTLNTMSLVFGFTMDYGITQGDNLKLFRDRLDFAVDQYPNHIDFPQIQGAEDRLSAKPTAFFSDTDLKFARDSAFACITFYTSGRAVPWFLSVLKPLKIKPSRFFADFSEWQRESSCSYRSEFNPDKTEHKDIEKMQLSFLELKYEEKGQKDLFPVIRDIVTLNGAFARAAGEGEECTVELSYNPDDITSPEAFDPAGFYDTVCMESCKVKIFLTDEGPDYRII